MPHATLADAPVFSRDGFTFRPLAVPSRGSSELAVWQLESAPGAASAPHTLDREEVFVVAAGRMRATVGAAEHVLAAGDALIVPAGELFRLSNDDPSAPAQLTVCTRAGIQATIGGETITPPWSL
jgi:quercetin dioxygenase-like cupin family protein